MKSKLDCIQCQLRQGIEIIKLSIPNNFNFQKKLLNEILEYFQKTAWESMTPVELMAPVYRHIALRTSIIDPFKNIKTNYNELAKKLVPELKVFLRQSENRLISAITIASRGNFLDASPGTNYDICKKLNDSFAIWDFDKFSEMLQSCKNILYLGDNAGEVFFDRFLIEHLISHGKNIVYAVRGGPAMDDAMLEDAQYAELDKITRVITTGCDMMGVVWIYCSKEFKEEFGKADLIIAKGQGNFEGLTEEDVQGKERIFLLLQAKCRVIADYLKVKQGSGVFKWLGKIL